jgi:hypothetical protein
MQNGAPIVFDAMKPRIAWGGELTHLIPKGCPLEHIAETLAPSIALEDAK